MIFQTFRGLRKCRFSWYRERFWDTGKIQWGGIAEQELWLPLRQTTSITSISLPWWQGWNKPSWWFVLMWKNFLIYLRRLTSKEVAVASPCKYLLFPLKRVIFMSWLPVLYCCPQLSVLWFILDSFCLSAQMPFTTGCDCWFCFGFDWDRNVLTQFLPLLFSPGTEKKPPRQVTPETWLCLLFVLRITSCLCSSLTSSIIQTAGN